MTVQIQNNWLKRSTSQTCTSTILPDMDTDDNYSSEQAMPGSSYADSMDSGYASQTTLSLNEPEYKPTTLLPTRKSLFQRKVKLRPFTVPIPEEVRNRFRDLKLLFDRPLYDYLSKEGTRPAPVAITLQYLGENDAKAKPWIVVLCDKSVVKKVKQWFNTDSVRSYLRSTDMEPGIPTFEVLVHDRAPRLLSTEVYSDPLFDTCTGIQSSVCGRLIKIDDPTYGRFATMGGLLKISWGSEFTVCGITAHHVFDQDLNIQETISESGDTPTPRCLYSTFAANLPDSYEEDIDDDDLDDLDDVAGDFYELDLSSEDDFTAEMLNSDYAYDMRIAREWTALGSAYLDNDDVNEAYTHLHEDIVDSINLDKQKHDWSLIKIHDLSRRWTNWLHSEDFYLNLKSGPDLDFDLGLGKKVWIMSGVSGVRSGFISDVPSFLAIMNGEELTETYCVKLANGDVLRPGDSGSWIVDITSGEVYGQIVASDPFGNAYAISFANIITDIKQVYQATDVSFPSLEDLGLTSHHIPAIETYLSTEIAEDIHDLSYPSEISPESSYSFTWRGLQYVIEDGQVKIDASFTADDALQLPSKEGVRSNPKDDHLASTAMSISAPIAIPVSTSASQPPPYQCDSGYSSRQASQKSRSDSTSQTQFQSTSMQVDLPDFMR